MKTFLHIGFATKRKDRTTAGFADWDELHFDIDESVQPDLYAVATKAAMSEEELRALGNAHFPS